MAGPSEMRCPFPACNASWWNKQLTVPTHAMNNDTPDLDPGKPSCPGSGARYVSVLMRWNLDGLTVATREAVLAAWRRWQEAEADQRQRNKALPTDPASGFLGMPLGGRRHGVDPDAFPPRRGDPGAPDEDWKPKPKTLPMDQVGQPLGRAAMENARDTHRQLVLLTISKIDEVQGALARLNTTLQLAEGRINEIGMHAAAAGSLCTVAIGHAAGDLPAEGQAMAANLILAAHTVGDPNTLRNHLTMLQATSNAMYQQLAAAVEHGRNYAASL